MQMSVFAQQVRLSVTDCHIQT